MSSAIRFQQRVRLVDRVTKKPLYLWRPDQMLRRVANVAQRGDEVTVTLPWGARLTVMRGDHTTAGIVRRGVHELAVTETMWRLASSSDLTLDIGANAGYFTSLLAYRARKVIAFEPHPLTVQRLRSNVDGWCMASVDVHAVAASGSANGGVLREPPDFAWHSGQAHLARADDLGPARKRGHEVPTMRLDDVIGEDCVGLIKVDVEGHEAEVFEGLLGALGDGRVRDLLFESLEPLPTRASEILSAHGLAIFAINEGFWGPELTTEQVQPHWEAPMYLATRNAA